MTILPARMSAMDALTRSSSSGSSSMAPLMGIAFYKYPPR
jgi:hypothetical protein